MKGMAGKDLEAILDKLFVFGKGGPFQDLVPSIGFIIEERMPDVTGNVPGSDGSVRFPAGIPQG